MNMMKNVGNHVINKLKLLRDKNAQNLQSFFSNALISAMTLSNMADVQQKHMMN